MQQVKITHGMKIKVLACIFQQAQGNKCSFCRMTNQIIKKMVVLKFYFCNLWIISFLVDIVIMHLTYMLICREAELHTCMLIFLSRLISPLYCTLIPESMYRSFP